MRQHVITSLLVLGAVLSAQAQQQQWVIVEGFKASSDCSRPSLVASYEAYRPDSCVAAGQQTGGGTLFFRKYSCTSSGIVTDRCTDINCNNCTGSPTTPFQQCAARSTATLFPFIAPVTDVYQFDYLNIRCGELPAGAQGVSIQDHYGGRCEGVARSRTFTNVGAQCGTRKSGQSNFVSTYSSRADCGNTITITTCTDTTCSSGCTSTAEFRAGECNPGGFRYFCGSATSGASFSNLATISLLLASVLIAILI